VVIGPQFIRMPYFHRLKKKVYSGFGYEICFATISQENEEVKCAGGELKSFTKRISAAQFELPETGGH